MHVSDCLPRFRAVYIERVVWVTTSRSAGESRVRGGGKPGERAWLSLIEVLRPARQSEDVRGGCTALGADVMEKTYSLGVFCDRTKDGRDGGNWNARIARCDSRASWLGDEELPEERAALSEQTAAIDLHVRCGFGGQGVLLLGEVLAEAADAGLISAKLLRASPRSATICEERKKRCR